MIEAYPLCWPVQKPRTRPSDRKRANFGKKVKHSDYSYYSKKELSMEQATTRLLSELHSYTRVGHNFRVPKDSIIISTNVPIRKDGLPYSNFRKVEDTGVAVYFTLDGNPYCLPCDKWDRVEDNVAAIAAHISAMRGIERWGVGTSHDVYTGFKALPNVGETTMEDCWSVLGITPTDKVDAITKQYKILSKSCHPDSGGTREQWDRLQSAYQHAIKSVN